MALLRGVYISELTHGNLYRSSDKYLNFKPSFAKIGRKLRNRGAKPFFVWPDTPKWPEGTFFKKFKKFFFSFSSRLGARYVKKLD